ncbi:MAG: 5'-3' exonuclease H3TH domain-containing protein [Gammaproteobacteria bacterium]|jgi:5'-3' exonuclease
MSAYLIDASIYIFQAHFSPYVECYDADGENLGALYGFSQFLLQFLRRENPHTVAVAMDESLFCGFRHQLCDAYKSNRELPDDNLAYQLQACAQLCSVLGLANFGSRKYEADDIIGTLARRLRSEGRLWDDRLVIVTRDKDLAQLLRSEKDHLWDYQKNSRRGPAEIQLEFGVSPSQIPDYLGLVGDAVDRISGIPGLGPVKGRALLQEYSCLDDIYNNLQKVGALPLRGAAKLGQLLENHREQAYLSKTLATIVEDVVDPDEKFSIVGLDALQREPADTERLADFLRRYKFEERFCESMVKAAGRLNDSFK